MLKRLFKFLKKAGDRGALAVEASMGVTAFMFMMLFMYSYLPMYEGQADIGHALLNTADSLATDAFRNDQLGWNKVDTVNGVVATSIMRFIDVMSGTVNDFNGNYLAWHQVPVRETGNDIHFNGTICAGRGDEYGGATNTYVNSDLLRMAIEKRFMAYFSGVSAATGFEAKLREFMGGTSDPWADANERLKNKYHVKDGVNGLDFRSSYLDSKKVLHVIVKYEFEPTWNIPFFNKNEEVKSKLGKNPFADEEITMEMKQSCTSKLWL